jgi:hypothetical protein
MWPWSNPRWSLPTKAPGDVFSKRQAIEWFRQNYPSIKEGTVSAHLIRFSTNAPSRLHYNARPDEDLFFQVDRSHYRLYDPSNDPAPIRSPSDVSAADVRDERGEEEEELTGPSEFAYESDLRDFLARNLSTVEPDLTFYVVKPPSIGPSSLPRVACRARSTAAS